MKPLKSIKVKFYFTRLLKSKILEIYYRLSAFSNSNYLIHIEQWVLLATRRSITTWWGCTSWTTAFTSLGTRSSSLSTPSSSWQPSAETSSSSDQFSGSLSLLHLFFLFASACWEGSVKVISRLNTCRDFKQKHCSANFLNIFHLST